MPDAISPAPAIEEEPAAGPSDQPPTLAAAEPASSSAKKDGLANARNMQDFMAEMEAIKRDQDILDIRKKMHLHREPPRKFGFWKALAKVFVRHPLTSFGRREKGRRESRQ